MRRAANVLTPLSCLYKVGGPLFYKYPEKRIARSDKLVSQFYENHSSAKFYSSSVQGTETCWKCNHKWGISDNISIVCPNCNSLRKMNPEKLPNYFELLNHPKTYQVDLTSLAKQTKLLQKKLHPDLFSQHGQEEKKISEEMSSFVNKAYWTLQDPIRRGGYLLELHGIDFANDMEKQLTMDPPFLEEVMELNERLAEIKSTADWVEFRNENEAKLKDLQTDLGVAFNEQKLDEAKVVISKMNYFNSLQLKLKELQTKIGVVE